MTGEQTWLRTGTTSPQRGHPRPPAGLMNAALLSVTLIAGAASAQTTHPHGSYNDLLRDEALAKRTAAKPAPPPPEPDGLSGGGF